MKTGDQILVHNPWKWNEPVTYLSWIIRKVCGVFYNHSAIVLELYGIYYIVEAQYPKVIITEFSEWSKKRKRITRIDPIKSKFSEAQLRHRILAQVGKKYDWWSLLAILKFLVTGIWIGKRGTRATKKLYCFELVAVVHELENSYKIIPTQ